MLLTNKCILVWVVVTVSSFTVGGVAQAQPIPATMKSTVAPTTRLPTTAGTGFGGSFSNSVPEQPWWQMHPPKPVRSDSRKAKAPTKPQPIHLSWALSGDILFTSGSATLSVAADSQLVGIVAQAQLHPGCSIDITGYTDNVPDPTYPGGNSGLSLARARAVAKYFVTAGLSGDAITAKGYGAADPVGNEGTPQGRQLNRRVLISLVSK